MTLGKINLAVFAAIRCHQDYSSEFFWRVEVENLEGTNKLIKNIKTQNFYTLNEPQINIIVFELESNFVWKFK